MSLKDISQRNIEAIQLLLTDATSKLIGLLPLLFKEETVNKAIRIIELFVDINFIKFVFANSENKAECEFLRLTLTDILNCTQSSEHSSKVLRNRLFLRKRTLNELISSPSLLYFLQSEEASVLIWDWALECGKREVLNRLSFHSAVEEFKSLATRSLLPMRACVIVDKYLAQEAPCELSISESAKIDVLKLVKEDKITRALFSPAQREAILYLDAEFNSSFLKSDYFKMLQQELGSINARISFLYEPFSQIGCESEEARAGVDDNLDDDPYLEETHGSSRRDRLSVLWK